MDNVQTGRIVKARVSKIYFLANFWRALIFSGVPVLEEFQCRPLKVTKSQNFRNTPCKFPCLYNDPSLRTVDLRPFFALKKSTYLFRGNFLRPSNNTFKPSIETTSRGCFYLLKLIFSCLARLLLKHNLTNYCTPFFGGNSFFFFVPRFATLHTPRRTPAPEGSNFVSSRTQRTF